MMTMKFLWPASEVMVLALALTPETWAALIPATIAALFVGGVNMYVARTQRLLVEANIAKVEGKIDALKPVVDKIDTHVNGEKSRAESESARDKLQIEMQREIISELKMARDLLAQAKATADISTGVAQAAIAGATVPVAATNATVHEMKDHTTETP